MAAKWGSIVLVVIGTLGGPFAAVGIATGFAFLEVAGTVMKGALPEPKEEGKIPLAAPTATEVAIMSATP